MIIEFKLANYRSINTEQTMSFVAESARRHPDNLIVHNGYKILKATALFGANASGKSNILKGIEVMQEFVRNSATRMNEGDIIKAAEPFRLDPIMRDKPSRFEITFVTESIVYVYGFAATRKRVEEEWLTAKPEGKTTSLYEFRRTFSNTTGEEKWNFVGFKDADASQIIDRTLGNMLALSVGTQQKVENLRPAYRFLREKIWTFDMSNELDVLLMQTAEVCQNSGEMLADISSLLRDADTGVDNIQIETTVQNNVPDATPDMPEQFREVLNAVKKLAASNPMPRITAQRRDKNGNLLNFDFKTDESQGTQRFFAIAAPLLDALVEGAFVVIDELDASMHPLLTRRLLELFQRAEDNNGAQLLFTTHDPSLLDEDLFRRDQIWLAEKCDGASTFFSLADIRPPVRNTESFLRNYLTGRYGGTPHLGLAFDDLAVGGRL